MIRVRIKYEETVEKEIVLEVDEGEWREWCGESADANKNRGGLPPTDDALAKEFLEAGREPWDASLSDPMEGPLVERVITSTEVLR